MAALPGLSEANRRALALVRARVSGPSVDAPVTLHFHPDRRLADGRSVAAGLLRDGRYRNQFETGISNGGLTAYPGGDRDEWERALFGGAYQAPGVDAAERPKYGALNALGHSHGACAGWGSCHLRLRREINARTTFVFGDSNARPTEVVLAEDLAPLVERLRASGATSRTLDVYIEAQVHGLVRLREDVEALVADRAFAGTPTGDLMRSVAERHGVALEWHPGFALAPGAIPHEPPSVDPARSKLWQHFCAGGRARRLGERVAGASGRLDAANIGAATARAADEPEVLQELKYLWRMVVALGDPV
jgi:hypothetical protein